ncbi:class II aldolase/adducin family protein [Dactylosporangium sp. NPDC000244]|uniref:class II aldolase/adducin family protein n=1 Tax=Dactylosporangium sp. NPDC000244 TaxID=3154365 RepID=UPI00331F2FF1
MSTRTPDQERLYRRRQLAAAFRVFAEHGFDEGVAGHITARDPILTDHFWVNPFGTHFGDIRAGDLLLVDHAGQVVRGTGRINPAAFAIHAAVHAARPDVVAAAHAHSTFGRAWSALGRPLDPITQDACAFFEDHTVYRDFTGVVLDLDEGKRIAAALGGAKATILRNHGLLTVGHSVGEAAWWFVAMESCCQVQLAAEAAGTPVRIDAAEARATRETVGGHDIGRFSFGPLYRHAVRRDPGLLD